MDDRIEEKDWEWGDYNEVVYSSGNGNEAKGGGMYIYF